jgi:hypothetical protein
MNRHIETFEVEWHGIKLAISWEPQWLRTGEELGWDTAHLQVEAIAPERAMLPITETGYLSHFTTAAVVADMGGPLAFVRTWLDEEAASPAWRQQEAASRQFALF